ncbi:Transcription factor CPC [Sesamum alatum]|uniref:Transcription factor CPC n=1 Tax=Sesamum alatum TaxID=300844 RepID=A0AAE2CDW4_9LAMI|nr:Transcription factor CPC [Sesamum alatum]
MVTLSWYRHIAFCVYIRLSQIGRKLRSYGGAGNSKWIQSCLCNQISLDLGNLTDALGQIEKALLPSAVTSKALPAPPEATPTPSDTAALKSEPIAEANSTPPKVEAAPKPTPEVNSLPRAEVQEESLFLDFHCHFHPILIVGMDKCTNKNSKIQNSCSSYEEVSSMEWEVIKMSEEEEDIIRRMHNLVGDKWALIAGRIPGRKAEEIERFWLMTNTETFKTKTNRIISIQQQQHHIS